MSVSTACADANSRISSARPHLLVVQPVPAYSPPVVAEVVLNGWICHLRGERKGDSTEKHFGKGRRYRKKPLFTFSSSKLSVKCRISANCLARACSLSRCCMGAYGGLVSASSRLRRAFSANTFSQPFRLESKRLTADVAQASVPSPPTPHYSDCCKSL